MSKTENTHKMTIRLSPLTEFRLERDYRLDGSRSKNEFIERAITHYQDLLEAEQNETLPAAIQSAIDGRLGMFEDRISKLLYKLTVEMDMGMNAVLDCVQVDDDYLRRLRSDSVRNVKATNGLLTFERSGLATTTLRNGAICSGLTAMKSRRLCTSRPRTSAGMPLSTMRATIPTST